MGPEPRERRSAARVSGAENWAEGGAELASGDRSGMTDDVHHQRVLLSYPAAEG